MQRPPASAATVIVCGLLLTGCGESGPGSGQSPEPAPASSPDLPVTEGPRITFERTAHDFGRITDTRKQTAVFPFANTGTETLVISDITASCGCTVPMLNRRVFPPGEGDAISVTFDPTGRPGITDKTIDIVSNAMPNPVAKLRISAVVDTMLRCERFHRLGDLRLGEEHTSVIRLSYDDPELVVRHATVSQPFVTARITEMGRAVRAAGQETTYEGTIEVTLSKDAPWGALYATRVKVMAYGRPDPQSEPTDFEYTVHIMGNIWGELRAEPVILGFGPVSPSQPYEKAVTLSRPSGAPFTVTGARVSESSMAGVQVRVEPGTATAHRIIIHGSPGGNRGAFKGVVTVNTDVPGEEAVRLRFAGIIK